MCVTVSVCVCAHQSDIRLPSSTTIHLTLTRLVCVWPRSSPVQLDSVTPGILTPLLPRPVWQEHTTPPGFFLWLLGIHTQVLMSVQKALCPLALFFPRLSSVLAGWKVHIAFLSEHLRYHSLSADYRSSGGHPSDSYHYSLLHARCMISPHSFISLSPLSLASLTHPFPPPSSQYLQDLFPFISHHSWKLFFA